MTARLPSLRAVAIFVAAGRALSFTEAAKAVNGGTKSKWGDQEIDWANWRRLTMREAIIQYWPEAAGARPQMSDFASHDSVKVLVERYGLPLERIRVELVHGCLYFRPIGLGMGAQPRPLPPALIMKVVVRLYPALRRRNSSASTLTKALSA